MSNNRLYKSHGMDKYDAYIPPKQNFIHDDYYVSHYQECFHLSSAYASRAKGRGWTMGVQKKMWQASGRGIMVDGSGTGKSDQ
jgi:hypothetical protein